MVWLGIRAQRKSNSMDQIATERVNGKGKGPKGVVDPAMTYSVEVEIEGTEAMLCHRYDPEAVKSKGAAKKGSKEKKSDNIESYVYRLENGDCGFPGINFKSALCETARYQQDPRSPRKSARDLFRAAIKVRGEASFGKQTWDYEDVRKVNVQRNAVARNGEIWQGEPRPGETLLGLACRGEVRRGRAIHADHPVQLT